jgi:hypothetical protein
MKRIFRRDGKATDRHEIASLVDIPLLSKPLKSVIEESLRECGKERYRKRTILTPTFVVLAVLGLAIRRDFHELTSVAFDGTSATMADTKGNKQRFGVPNGGRGEGGYPQPRAVA